MDPASVLGLVSAVINIADVIAKSVTSLRSLQSKYQHADFRLGALVSQLLTIKAALGHVADIINSPSIGFLDHGAYSQQFSDDLRVSLSGCEAMICALDGQLANLHRDETNGLTRGSKFTMAWEDSTIDGYLTMLSNQTSALQLLLTSLQCRSSFARNDILQKETTRRIFEQIKDDTSSLLWLYDEESLLSFRSAGPQPDLSTVTAEFSFDGELMTSKVYRTAMRSHMIFAIGGGGNRAAEAADDESPSGRPPSMFRMSRRFSIHSTRLPEIEDSGSVNSTLLNRDSVSSRAHMLSPTQGRTHDHVQVQARPRYDDASSLRSSSTSLHSVANASLRRFWRRREQLSAPSKPILAVAPAFAPKDATNIAVLGTSESGKSTLVKSLIYTFGGYDIRTRRSYIEDIFRQTVDAMLVLTRGIAEATRDPNQWPLNPAVGSNIECSFAWELKLLETSLLLDDFCSTSMDPAVTKALSVLWAQPELRASLANLRAQDYLPQSTEYFLESIERLTKANYLPSASDILRTYQKTVGISLSNFEMNGKSYNFFDVGGTRVERRKWVHALSQADMMVYTFDVACSGDTTMYNSLDAMDEQVNVLKSLLDSPRVTTGKAVIIFTKVDKLTPRVIGRLLSSELFRTYVGDTSSVEGVLGHLARELASLGKEPWKKITFWKASIAWSSTELADVALTALEQLDTEIDDLNG